MAQTVLGLFDEFRDAANAVQALIGADFPREDIGILSQDAATKNTSPPSPAEGDFVVAGVGVGGILGGLTGLVVGLGVLTIPAVGPVIAAGPLASTLADAALGAAGGSLVGVLSELGVSQIEAKHYAEGVSQGGTLVTVKADENRVERAIEILQGYGAVDIDQHIRRRGLAGESGSERTIHEDESDSLRDRGDG